MRAILMGLALVLTVGGCSQLPQLPESGEISSASASDYLQGGPTVSLDDPGMRQEPTTLQRLRQRTEELELSLEESKGLKRSNLAFQVEVERLRKELVMAKEAVTSLHEDRAVAENDLRDVKEALIRTQIENTRLQQRIVKNEINRMTRGMAPPTVGDQQP